MKYHQLDASTNKKSKRVGRGISSGSGKTAGRGTKGQKSRTGYSRRPGFEGGQSTFIQRMPKLRGFKSHHKTVEAVSLASVLALKETTIDSEVLATNKLISNPYVKVKLIGKADVTKKLHVKLPAISSGALEAVKKAGGKLETQQQKSRPSQKTSPKTEADTTVTKPAK